MRSPSRLAPVALVGLTQRGTAAPGDVCPARARNIRTGEVCSARVVLSD
jgi:hypothetical protein